MGLLIGLFWKGSTFDDDEAFLFWKACSNFLVVELVLC